MFFPAEIWLESKRDFGDFLQTDAFTHDRRQTEQEGAPKHRTQEARQQLEVLQKGQEVELVVKTISFV